MSNVELFLRYLQERPIVLKLLDVSLIMAIVLTLGATYIVATNFRQLFMNGEQIEYERFLNAAETNRQITSMLTSLRQETNAARVGIFQFHNGTMGMGSMPFFFYTQTFEAIAPGISSELQNNQRISLTTDPDIIILKDAQFGAYHELDKNTPFGYILSSRGTNQYFRYAIFSLSGDFVGFLTLEYIIKTDMTDDELSKILERYAGAITGYLNNDI